MFDAVSIALANGFRKKGTQPTNWVEEPYRLMPYTSEELAERAEAEREKTIAFLNAWANGGTGTDESEVK